MAGIHQQDQIGEKRADTQTENHPQRQRMDLAREHADDDAGQQAFDRRPDHNPDQLIADFGREPRRHAVEDTEKTAEQRCKQHLFHRALSLPVYYTAPGGFFKAVFRPVPAAERDVAGGLPSGESASPR